MNMPAETVSFQGDTLLVVRDENGQGWVAVRSICDALGIDSWNQLAKLRGDPKFVRRDITAHDSSGRQQEMTCIPINQLNGWLFTINAKKVKPECREKLLAYQAECFNVLSRHFMPQGVAAAEVIKVMSLLNDLNVRFDKRFAQLEQTIEARSAMLSEHRDMLREQREMLSGQRDELDELRAMLECVLDKKEEDELRALIQEVKKARGMDGRAVVGQVKKLLGVHTPYEKRSLAQAKNVLRNMLGRGVITVK